MKIEYVQGNLVDTDLRFIGHGVNCQGVMNSGVAKVIREKWPEVFYSYREFWRDFRDAGRDDSDLLGLVNWVVVDEDRRVLNMFTQDRFWYDGHRYMSYEALAQTLEHLNTTLPEFDSDVKLALPVIGAGRGGGNWKIISTIIEETLTNVQPVVYQL
jgi:O-acetyl-ADP-ribose deacetylase (regulator of RNase III)